VTCKDFKPEQVARFDDVIARHLRYLNRARERLKGLGIAPADPLYRDVEAAYVATFNLHVTAMYLAMDGSSIASVAPAEH
jgi:hypothetical protein